MAEENAIATANDEIIEDYYIAPDTEIYILKGVPLDNTYEHTIYWEPSLDRAQQRNYFISKAKIELKKHSYQRVDREWLKVYVNVEHLYDCNYIMFRNTAFNPDKWWYGFITDVEYINDNASKIKYEIDVMQSWLPSITGSRGDYQVMPCFVERCHSSTDRLYDNIIPENIVNADEYVVDAVNEFDMNEMSVIALTTEVYDGEDALGNAKFKAAEGSVKYGTFGAVDITRWNITTSQGVINTAEVTRLKRFLTAYINAGKENSVVSLVMCPRLLTPLDYMTSGSTSNSPPPENNSYEKRLTNPKKGDKLGGSVNGMIPRNAKLYSYPFNLIRINNECGTTRVYKWELFDEENRGVFIATGTDVWSPSAIIYPKKYKNISKNMSESVTFNAFPVCPWSSDSYAAWWAQNAAGVGVTAFGGVASLAAAIVGGGSNPMLLATGIGGVISSASKIATSLYEAEHRPAEEHGNNDTSLVLPAIKNIKFVITKESLRPEMLKLYDDYFTKYGYAQKRIMYPPLKNRKRWTYVQTVGFEFSGTINDKDSKKIKSIFDNGITFWARPDDIGHYEYDNDPLY